MAVGFTKIENMAQFTDLKCVYLEGNGTQESLTNFQDSIRLKDQKKM